MRSETAPNPETPDETLLAATAGGDLAAFHTFYERHAGRVLGYARRICHDAALAEDVTQEVFQPSGPAPAPSGPTAAAPTPGSTPSPATSWWTTGAGWAATAAWRISTA